MQYKLSKGAARVGLVAGIILVGGSIVGGLALAADLDRSHQGGKDGSTVNISNDLGDTASPGDDRGTPSGDPSTPSTASSTTRHAAPTTAAPTTTRPTVGPTPTATAGCRKEDDDVVTASHAPSTAAPRC